MWISRVDPKNLPAYQNRVNDPNSFASINISFFDRQTHTYYNAEAIGEHDLSFSDKFWAYNGYQPEEEIKLLCGDADILDNLLESKSEKISNIKEGGAQEYKKILGVIATMLQGGASPDPDLTRAIQDDYSNAAYSPDLLQLGNKEARRVFPHILPGIKALIKPLPTSPPQKSS